MLPSRNRALRSARDVSGRAGSKSSVRLLSSMFSCKTASNSVSVHVTLTGHCTYVAFKNSSLIPTQTRCNVSLSVGLKVVCWLHAKTHALNKMSRLHKAPCEDLDSVLALSCACLAHAEFASRMPRGHKVCVHTYLDSTMACVTMKAADNSHCVICFQNDMILHTQ